MNIDFEIINLFILLYKCNFEFEKIIYLIMILKIYVLVIGKIFFYLVLQVVMQRNVFFVMWKKYVYYFFVINGGVVQVKIYFFNCNNKR